MHVYILSNVIKTKINQISTISFLFVKSKYFIKLYLLITLLMSDKKIIEDNEIVYVCA